MNTTETTLAFTTLAAIGLMFHFAYLAARRKLDKTYLKDELTWQFKRLSEFEADNKMLSDRLITERKDFAQRLAKQIEEHRKRDLSEQIELQTKNAHMTTLIDCTISLLKKGAKGQLTLKALRDLEEFRKKA